MLVSSQYSLIQRHFSSRIHTGIPLFENVAQYGKIFKSPSRQKIAQKALLIQQDIHIKVMVRQEDPRRLDIGVVTGQVQRRGDYSLVERSLLGFELANVVQLAHADVYRLYAFLGEASNYLLSVLFDGHGEGSFEFQVESVWLLEEFDRAVRMVFLHFVHEHADFGHLLGISYLGRILFLNANRVLFVY